MRSQRSTGEPTGIARSSASVASAAAASIVCTAPPSSIGEQVVERRLVHLGLGQLGAELLRAPHGHPGERLAVGQVHPPHPQHLVHAEHLADRGRAPARSANSPIRRSEVTPEPAELLLERAEPAERLAHGLAGHEPPEPLAGVDPALGPEHLERLADGDPARRVRRATARPRWAAAGRPRTRPRRASPAEILGDLLVADRAHLSYSCIIEGERKPPPLTRPDRGAAVTVTAGTPIELVRARSTAASPERVRTAAGSGSGQPLTFAEKVLVNHLRDPGDAGHRAGPRPTPTSTPTASRCRTPPRRWRCSSS